MKAIEEIEDVKVRKTYATIIIEEILTKKPFTKHLTLALLDDNVSKSVFDVVKLARECLKNLTSEDFAQLHMAVSMQDYEQMYKNIQGNNLENELAKIVLRYATEGKPEPVAPHDMKKQVRFDEEALEEIHDEQKQSLVEEGNRIWKLWDWMMGLQPIIN